MLNEMGCALLHLGSGSANALRLQKARDIGHPKFRECGIGVFPEAQFRARILIQMGVPMKPKARRI